MPLQPAGSFFSFFKEGRMKIKRTAPGSPRCRLTLLTYQCHGVFRDAHTYTVARLVQSSKSGQRSRGKWRRRSNRLASSCSLQRVLDSHLVDATPVRRVGWKCWDQATITHAAPKSAGVLVGWGFPPGPSSGCGRPGVEAAYSMAF
jgi:hypothetical protein